MRTALAVAGRPATNRVTVRLAGAFPIRFDAASFRLGDRTYAHPQTFVAAAGPNPLARGRSVVLAAGLGADGAWHGVRRFGEAGGMTAEVLLQESAGPLVPLAISPKAAPGTITASTFRH